MDRATPSRLALAASLGIAAGSLGHGLWLFPAPWLAPVASGLGLAALVSRRSALAAAFFGFALCFAAFDAHLSELAAFGPMPAGERTVEGKVVAVADIGSAERATIGTLTVASGGGEAALPARVRADFESGSGIATGERISFACRFREATGAVPAGTIVRDRIAAVCDSPRLVSVVAGPGLFTAAVAMVRDALVLALGRVLPSPHSDLAAGLILGSAAVPLPKPVMDAFRATGTSHIVAASGYNVTVVAAWFLALAFGIGLRRRTALVAGIAAVWLYVALAGFAPAVVRAGVMGSLAAAAQAIGRESRPLRALAVAAAAMLAFAPELLLFDVGFELTVAATVGLVTIGPRLSRRHPRLFGGTAGKLLAETVAATLATLPIALWRFGTLSPISLLANLAIVPAVPAAMALSAVAAVAGLAGPPFATLGAIAWTPLEYILRSAEALSRLPFASLSIGEFPWWGVPALYGLLALVLATGRAPTPAPPLREYEGWAIEEG